MQLLKCSACTRRFHLECVGFAAAHEAEWKCRHCISLPAFSTTDRKALARKNCSVLFLNVSYYHLTGETSAIKARVDAMRKLHISLKFRSSAFFARERAHFAPFVSPEHLRSLVRDADKAEAAVSNGLLTIDSSAAHIAGQCFLLLLLL